jgi:hypothetical protein
MEQVEDQVQAPPAVRTNGAPDTHEARQSGVHWDDSKMVTHFANVVNIQSTLEQVDLFFGTNKTWNVAGDRSANDRNVKVELTDRVILSPHAAKRLWVALGGVLKEYESRHGALKVDGRA